MGSVIVRVGCPHRLRQPITERTGTPCDACAAFGAPGWPREAWAMTVDYGPRLSEAATKAPAPIPSPTIKMPPEVATVFRAARLLAEEVGSWQTEAMRQITARGGLQFGSMHFVDDHIEQDMRIDRAIVEDVVRHMPPRLRIIP